MASNSKAQFQKVFANIRSAVNELDLQTLPEIAFFARDRIKTKAQTGKTAASGNEQSLKALSPKYVEQRKKWKGSKKRPGTRAKDLGQFFSPSRSNLTVTGQYLDSIEVKSIDQKKSEIVIAPSGDRKGEKLTNAKLGEYLSDGGRSIWGLDKTALNRIAIMVKADIRNSLLKKVLKK